MIATYRFEIDAHKKIIDEWLSQYGKGESKRNEIPRLGFISYDDEIPLAAIFLRQAEGNFGIIDGLVASPEVLGELRNQGIDKAVQSLLIEAKMYGFDKIIGWTNGKTIQRAERFGFIVYSYSLISKDLTKD